MLQSRRSLLRVLSASAAISSTDNRLTRDKQTPRGPERPLEVNCSNCAAKFVGW